MNRTPRCTLSGRWLQDGHTGVCLLTDHPRARIPRLVSGAPGVYTAKGWLRPERSLAYNDGQLLLHHAASVHPGVIFSAAQLAGFEKTASRLLALLAPLPWARLIPLDWPAPEEIHLTTTDDALVYDLLLLRRSLSQAEDLTLHRTPTWLQFRRC